MGNLFRVCGVLLIVGFLLPWYEVELKLGFLGKVKETFNGLGVARAGDLNFFLFSNTHNGRIRIEKSDEDE